MRFSECKSLPACTFVRKTAGLKRWKTSGMLPITYPTTNSPIPNQIQTQMKMMKPKGGAFACMHVKSLIFDGAVLLTGSVNMTHNGHENNKEHLYRIVLGSAVLEVLADFEKDWTGAEPVTQAVIDDMFVRFEKSKESRRSKSISRSLSIELEDADEPR